MTNRFNGHPAMLSDADLALHAGLGIEFEVLVAARVARLTSVEARDNGIRWSGDLSGVLYPTSRSP